MRIAKYNNGNIQVEFTFDNEQAQDALWNLLKEEGVVSIGPHFHFTLDAFASVKDNVKLK